MTTDRDVRLSYDQLCAIDSALTRRLRELRGKINAAHEAAAAGFRVQRGTLDGHITEKQHATTALDAVRVARQQIERRRGEL